MSKPMIMTLLEDLARGGHQNLAEATDLDALQITAVLDEIQVLKDAPSRISSAERGRILAGMSGLSHSNVLAGASVVTDVLAWLTSEMDEASAHHALLRGHEDFILEREMGKRKIGA